MQRQRIGQTGTLFVLKRYAYQRCITHLAGLPGHRPHPFGARLLVGIRHQHGQIGIVSRYSADEFLLVARGERLVAFELSSVRAGLPWWIGDASLLRTLRIVRHDRLPFVSAISPVARAPGGRTGLDSPLAGMPPLPF